MDRKQFLKVMAAFPLAGSAMKLSALGKLSESFASTPRMPVLFVGHGSPMNAIEENEFVSGFRNVSRQITKPNAILCISAHWETRGTFVSSVDKPETIHDFGGFPKELFEVQYPAPGSPGLAKQTKSIVKKTAVGIDEKWGLDHGAWSVIKHMYPSADIPVIQLSLDFQQDAKYHYELAGELKSLRQKGILIVGSGNMVHNLGMMDWKNINSDNYAFDWAKEAGAKMKRFILEDNHLSLINYKSHGKPFQLAIPTPEHYLPLLYTLALKDKGDELSLFNDKAVAGSITMTSVKIG